MSRKLTPETLTQLFREYVDTDVTQLSLATRYGITQAHVSNLLHDSSKHGDLAETVRVAHARPRGRRAHTVDAAAVVRDYAAGGVNQTELATKYGVSQSRIARIVAAGRAVVVP